MKFYWGLQQLNVGRAAEAGIAIVLLAIVLDRITQSYGERLQARNHASKKGEKLMSKIEINNIYKILEITLYQFFLWFKTEQLKKKCLKKQATQSAWIMFQLK